MNRLRGGGGRGDTALKRVELMPTVKFYAGFRKIAARNDWTSAAHTVREVLIDVGRLNALLGAAILDGQNVRPFIVMTLNGRVVADLDEPVGNADVLAVFPPIAGG